MTRTIVLLFASVLIIDLKSEAVQRLRSKRRVRADLAQFDVTEEEKPPRAHVVRPTTHASTAEPFAERLESEIGRGYEVLGHSTSKLRCCCQR